MNSCNLSEVPPYQRGKKPAVARGVSKRRRPRTILVIEQEDEVRATLCDWLRGAGFAAVGENNGHSGLSRIVLRERTMQPIDGVLMSMDLRFFGSRAVLVELREQHPSLPVVVMAEPRRVEAIWEAMQLGALGYLFAPFDPESFQQKCRAFFRDPDKTE